MERASEKIKRYDQLTKIKKRCDDVAENSFPDAKAAKEKNEQNLAKVVKQFPSGD